MDADDKHAEEAPEVQTAAPKLAVAEDELIDSETAWDSLGLDLRLLKAITRLGYKNPTLVQSKGIPLALKGKDILAKARTGSGKTAAYMLPILHRVLEEKEKQASNAHVRALVLVPTRELCEQVKAVVSQLIRYCSKTISCVHLVGVGKAGMQPEKLALREHPDVVVATPSRLVEHLKANNIAIKALQFLVVDEADLILSYGYEEDIRNIAEHLPRVCQGFLMSATLNPEVDSLKQLVLHTPAVLKLNEAVQKKATLKEYSITCSDGDKYLIAYVLIRLNLLPGKTLFFTNSIDRGYRFRLFLEKFSLKAAVLNSELPHKSRQHILKEFNQGVFDYLIAVDDSAPTSSKKAKKGDEGEADEQEEVNDEDGEGAVTEKRKRKATKDSEFGVARGVDFKGVKAVINFDFPPSASSYTHRIGRTARGGEVGMALSFVTPEDVALLEEVKEHQAAEGKDLQPYNFKMTLVDGFRYRVEDVLRTVTSLSVKDARLAEIKSEILNSEKLKAHFEDNPRDLQLLQHDRPLSKDKAPEHLKHIPFYIMPSSRPAAAKRARPERPQAKGKKARTDDPLRSFSYDGKSRAPPAAAARDENEIDVDGDAEAHEPAEKEDDNMSDVNSEELKDMGTSYKLAFGKKVMKERKLKYMRGPGKKQVVDRIREQIQQNAE